jgi:serine/threonine protein kinase
MENNLAYSDLVGTMLDGRYKIEECLGTGGMSVVFRATDTSDGTAVAIKMLKDETANDKNSLEQFINESNVVSMLSHPNIVSIRDVSIRTERKYLVMEYIEGISLRTYMDKRGALELDEFFSFSEQILAALEHAHSRGVIHRDIKPQNILVLKDGFVKVPKDEMPKSKHMAIGLYYKWGYLVNVYVFPDGYVYAKDPHNLNEVYKCIEPSDYSTYYGIFYNLYQNDKF